MTSKQLTRKQFIRLGVGIVGVVSVSSTLGCPGDDGTGDAGNDSGTGTPGTTDATIGDDTTGNGTTASPATDTGDPPGTSTGPGDSSGSPTDTGATGCTADPDVTIVANHGHELIVPLADVEAGVEVTYEIQGTSPHMHQVTLSPADFTALQSGMPVVVQSTEGGAHTHEVTVSC